MFKQAVFNLDGRKVIARRPAPCVDLTKRRARKTVMQEIKRHALLRGIEPYRCQQHLQLRQIALIQRDQKMDGVHKSSVSVFKHR